MFPKILKTMYWKNKNAVLLILIINIALLICHHYSPDSTQEVEKSIEQNISKGEDNKESNSKSKSR